MNQSTKSLVISYLEGEISKTDEKILIQWMKKNPDAVSEFYDFAKIWELTELHAKMGGEYLEKQWSKLLQKVLAYKHESNI